MTSKDVICKNCSHARNSHIDKGGGVGYCTAGCPCPGFESVSAAESLPAEPKPTPSSSTEIASLESRWKSAFEEGKENYSNALIVALSALKSYAPEPGARVEEPAKPTEGDREEKAEQFIRESGKTVHSNTCATSIAPAEESGPCDCDEIQPGAPGDVREGVELPKLDDPIWFDPERGEVITLARNRSFGKVDVLHGCADMVLQRERQLLFTLRKLDEATKENARLNDELSALKSTYTAFIEAMRTLAVKVIGVADPLPTNDTFTFIGTDGTRATINKEDAERMFSRNLAELSRLRGEKDGSKEIVAVYQRVRHRKYLEWTNAGGPAECKHGRADGIPCIHCDITRLDEYEASEIGLRGELKEREK